MSAPIAGCGAAALASGCGAMLVTARWLTRGFGRRWIIAVIAAGLVFAWRAGGSSETMRAAWIEFVELFVGAFAIALGASALKALRGGRRAGPLEAAPVVGPAWFLGTCVALGACVSLLALSLGLAGVLSHGGPLRVTAAVPPPEYRGTVRWIAGDPFAAGAGGEIVWTLPTPPVGDRWALETRLRVIHHRTAPPGLVISVTGPGVQWRAHASPERPVVVPLPPDFRGGRLVMRTESGGLSVRALATTSLLRANDEAAASTGWLKFALTTASRALLLLAVALAVSIATAPPIAAAAALTCWGAGWVAPFLRDFSAHSIVPSIMRARVELNAAADPGRSRLTWFFDWVPDLRSGPSAERLVQGLAPTWSDITAEIAPRLMISAVIIGLAGVATAFVWRRTVSRKLGEGWTP